MKARKIAALALLGFVAVVMVSPLFWLGGIQAAIAVMVALVLSGCVIFATRLLDIEDEM
jgi:predicted membrane protein